MASPKTKSVRSRKRARQNGGGAVRNAYEVIAERVLDALEQGVAPWRRSWVTLQPQSVHGHRYRGVNALLLGLADYGDPRWITYRQAMKAGGHVRRGERGEGIIFWRWIDRDDEAGEGKRGFPLARIYTVFNVEQCDGIELPTIIVPALSSSERIAAAEAIAAGYLEGTASPPRLQHRRATAPAYAPARDVVRMPPQDQFVSADAYYATLFHEIGHSTGHESRLNRSQRNAFGTHDYGREELVAEFCTAYLCAEAGISPEEQGQAASYLVSWIGAIKADRKIVLQAAASAQRAADLVLLRDHESAALPAAA